MIELPVRGGTYAPESWEWSEWQRIYGEKGIDVEVEMKKARQWLLANPRRRPKNGKRYLINWLNRAHETKPDRDVTGAASSYRARVEQDFKRRQKAHNELSCNEDHAMAELTKIKKLLGMRR